MQDDNDKVSPRQVEAFERFVKLLPYGNDLTLVILKGHLLIEEQVRQIIDERVKKPDVLKDARFDCYQAICLAEALCPMDEEPWFWEAVRKLNKIRNDISHNIELDGLEDQVHAFADFFPSGLDADDRQDQFELTLWSLFERVSSLVERPTGTVHELVKVGEKET